MHVLVTGHQGYIGSVLVPLLEARGHRVSGLDAGYFAPCVLGPVEEEPEPDRTDLRDVTTRDLEGVEAVVHLAALSNDPLGDLDPGLTVAINEEASIRFAEMAREIGVQRFVFSSSCSLYGAAGDGFLDESAPFHPVTPYGRSKIAMEEALLRLADEEFSPVLLRNATAYGVSPRLRLDLVLNNLVAWAVTTGEIVLLSDGTPWRPVVHVEDICHAVVAALEAPREAVHARAFNIGRTEENFQIRELAEIVAEAVPGCGVELAPDAAPDSRTYRVSCRRAEEELPGYAPEWTAERGARQLAEAYRRHGLTKEEFDGPRFKRLARVQQLRETGELDEELRWSA